jgi:hypothetical protein
LDSDGRNKEMEGMLGGTDRYPAKECDGLSDETGCGKGDWKWKAGRSKKLIGI